MDYSTLTNSELGNTTTVDGGSTDSMGGLGSILQGAVTAAAVGAILADPATEDAQIAGDRVDEEVLANTAITTQEATVPTVMEQSTPNIVLDTSNQDCSGNMKDMTDRWIKIKEVDWKTTDHIYKLLNKKMIIYPNDILKVDTVYKSFTHFFAYFRADIEIMATCTGTKFHQGAVAICYAARDDVNSVYWLEETARFRNIRMVPHTILNMQNSTSGKFLIPYNNLTALFDRENMQGRGAIFVVPWARLLAPAGGNTTLPVALFSSLKNLKVYAMTKEKSPFSTTQFQTARRMFQMGFSKMESDGKDHTFLKLVMKTLTDTFPDAFAEGIPSTINVGAHVFNTANVIQGENFVQDLSFLGETCIQDSSVVSSRPITYKDLLKIPVPITTVNWKKTDASGKILWQSPIGPLLFNGNTTTTNHTATKNWIAWEQINVAETMVDHVAKFARYWRGNLKFTFEFFNAGLMKGRVKIGVLFGERTYSSENSCYFITHDLGVQDKCELVVPYNSWRDWMEVPGITTQFILRGSGTKKFKPKIEKACTLGVIGIEVINTLTVTSSMVNNLDIKVSVSTDNFQLAWPTFGSRHYDFVANDYGWAWEGMGRGMVVNSAVAPESFYPTIQGTNAAPTYKPYGDVPLLENLELAEADFVGSFAAQSDVSAAQPTLPTTCPFKSSYIGNHVEISSLMTRPALAAHATVWVVQDDSHLTGTNTFEVKGESGILIVAPGNTGIAEIGIKESTNSLHWPWENQVKPLEHQQEVCRLGTYWSGSAKIHIAISDYEHAEIRLQTKVEPHSAEKKATSTASGALLFFTFSDEPNLTTKDVMSNGAYCINLGQQKMVSFNIPWYQIEQQKRLSGTDLRWRLFLVTREEITFDLHVWISFGSDFKLYWPTLMPDRKWFGGTSQSGIATKSWFYYPESPANWNKFPPGPTENNSAPVLEVEKESADGAGLSLLKTKCRCTCSAGVNVDELDAQKKREAAKALCVICNTRVAKVGVFCLPCAQMIRDYATEKLMRSGDVETNPGPCVKCGITALPNGACECEMRSGEFNHLISRNHGDIFKQIPHNLQRMMLEKLRSGQGINLNDVATHFQHEVNYKVIKKHTSLFGETIEVTARLAFHNRGELVYYNSVIYCGKTESGIHKELRRKLLDRWLSEMRKRYPGFFQMCDLCNELDFRCEGLFDTIKSTMEGIVCKITDVGESLLASAALLANAKSYLDDAKMRLYIFVAKLMLNIANIIMNSTKANALFIVAAIGLDIVSLPGISVLIVKTITAHVESFYQTILMLLHQDEEPQAEGVFDMVPQIASMFSLLLVGVMGVSASSADLAACVSSVVSTFKCVGAVTSGLKGVAWMVDMFWKVFSGVLNYFQGGFTLEERACIYFKENKEIIYLWDKEVSEVEALYTKGKTIMDEGLRAKVHELFKTGAEIHTGCLHAKETAHLFAKLRANYAKVSKWNHELLKMEGVFRARPEPTVVYLYGEPGQGKSLMSTMVAREMSTFMKVKPDNYYSIPPNFKHLDNYAQQPVVIIDDLGQGSDDEDWKIFCQMVSTTPFVAPQADLADKGMAFTSPFIVATSNITNPRPLTVNNPDAVQRRLKFKVCIAAQRAYTDTEGNLDFGKAIIDDKVKDLSCLSIYRVDDGWQHGQDISYAQLMHDVKSELIRRKVNMEAMANTPVAEIDDYDTMLDNARAHGLQSPGIFEACPQCGGTKLCMNCENKMRDRDGFPQLSIRAIADKVTTETDGERQQQLALLREDDILYLTNNTLHDFYELCSNAFDFDRYYNTVAFMREDLFLKDFRKYCERQESAAKPYAKWGLAIACVASVSIVIGMLVMAFKGVSWWLGSEPEAYNQGASRKMKPQQIKKVAVGVKAKTEGKCTMIEDILMRNQEFVTFYAGDKACTSGMVTFLDSTTILTCKHLLLEPEDSKLTHFRINQDTVYVDMPVCSDRMTEITMSGEDVDIVLITLASPMTGKKNIKHLFVTKEHAQWVETAPIHLMTKKGNMQRTVQANRPYIYNQKGQYKDTNGNAYSYPTIMRYNMADRGPGDSGGLVTSLHNTINGRVIGMHVAGTSAYGMALPLNRELIEEFLVVAARGPTDIAHIEPPIELDMEGESAHVYPFVGEKVTSLGDAPSGVTVARTTDIRPSPIAGVVLPVLREPAALHPGDVRVEENAGDPIWNMPKKFAKNTGFVDQRRLDNAVEHYSNIIECASNSEKAGVLTLEQGINGLPGQSMECIQMSTSPGYPYSQQPRPEKGKRAFFEETEVDGKPFYTAKDPLKKRISEREDLAKQRRRVEGSYYQTALKNELRTLKKVHTNAARTIEGCPLDYLILFRQYVGDFTNWITKNYGTVTGSCVGCNPDVDWTLFHQELTAMGDKFITVDFTNWDGSIPSQYIYAAVKVINNFYRAAFCRLWADKTKDEAYYHALGEFEEEQNVREVLFDELALTISVVSDQLVCTKNGLPSGHPLTAILNCIIHALKMLVAFQEATADKPEWTLAKYETNHKSLFYGDDGDTAVSDDLSKVFTRFDLARTSAREGMVCTMEDKDSEMTAFSPMEETSYLKRKFEKCELDSHIILAPIELRTIGSLLNWVRDNGTFEQNVEDAMWFLYHHGSKIYNEYKQKIMLALAQVGMTMILPTWKQQYQNHLIKFNKLESEWRVRPIVPKVSTLIARGIAANRLLMKKVDDVQGWTPFYGKNTLERHTCACKAVVFALVEGKCYRCLGVDNIPSWYFYKIKPKKSEHSLSNKSLLMRAGDVESNPGPFPAYEQLNLGFFAILIPSIIYGIFMGKIRKFFENKIVDFLEYLLLGGVSRLNRERINDTIFMIQHSMYYMYFLNGYVNIIFWLARVYVQTFYMLWALYERRHTIGPTPV